MAWNAKPSEMEPSMFFKSAKEIIVRQGVKVGIYGPPETGKSYFGQTFPQPVYIVDTELAAAKVAYQHFPDRDIKIFEAKIVDIETDKPDPIKSLMQVERAILSLKNVTKGTIVIDTVSDYWSWIGALVERDAKRRTQTGQPYRFEWATGNERYRYFIMRLLSRPVHVVLIAQTRKVYGPHGEETNLVSPTWQKQTPHWCDIVIQAKKEFIQNKWRYLSVIEKCRFQRAFNETVEDITFPKLASVLRNKLGVKVIFGDSDV